MSKKIDSIIIDPRKIKTRKPYAPKERIVPAKKEYKRPDQAKKKSWLDYEDDQENNKF